MSLQTTLFFKDIPNYIQIKKILQKYEIKYEKENDIEFFDELINGISEDYPKVQYLTIVLERILVYLVNRDLCIGRDIVENLQTIE
tara:strand:- start:1017 stop:1274 length:258 start_codon:yes stop_codon:yes gene_type:complete